MAGSDRLLGTIEAVHAAGLDDALWPNALASIARLFGAKAASLEDFEKRPMRLHYLKTAGLPSHGETAYIDYYARNNSRAQYAFRNLSKRFICDYDFTNERAMDRDPYYTKYLRPLDLRYFLSGQIANSPKFQAIVSIQRTRRQGHVDPADIKLMNLLVPHCRQAYDVTRRLADARARTQTFLQTLNWLTDGIALLLRDGRIVHVNDSMDEIARCGDGLRVSAQGIEFVTDEARSRYAAALDMLCRVADGDPWMHDLADFPAPRPTGAAAYIVSLRPLAGPHRHEHGAAAILFIRDPLAHDAGAQGLLRATFGFTHAEASLAQALQVGRSPADYASDRAISLNTVYTHLRRIKEKTGCKRITALIRKLNDLHVPLRIA